MDTDQTRLRLGLPKGRMQSALATLLGDAGIRVTTTPRAYRPSLSIPAEVKLLKPQNILRMVAAGSRDAGFAGADWVAELKLDVIEVMDTGLDPVRLVVAAPSALLQNGSLPACPLVLATEYENLAMAWMAHSGVSARVIRSYGATEVFPPEDSDLILDNTATGATLAANGLTILSEVMTSTTRLYASAEAMGDPSRRQAIEELALLLRSVLEARERVLIEVNVSAERLCAVAEAMPGMRQPTVSRLAGDAGFAVKAAVPRSGMVTLIPRLRALGATDLIISRLEQILP